MFDIPSAVQEISKSALFIGSNVHTLVTGIRMVLVLELYDFNITFCLGLNNLLRSADQQLRTE